MKLENSTAIVAGIICLMLCAIFQLPSIVLIITTIVATFGGWMIGCLLEIIFEYRHTKDPDPYYPPPHDDF